MAENSSIEAGTHRRIATSAMSHLPPPPPPPNPNPHFHHQPPPPPPPATDLSAALSTLSHLLRLAQTSLSLLPQLPTSNPPSLSSHHTPLLSSPNRAPFEILDRDADLCFSLEEYADFGTDFFYRDCPGAVSSSDHVGSTRTFTLPGILSIECANFLGGDNDKVIKMGNFVEQHNIRFLPSESWFIKAEIERWNDYPASYSYSILRAIMCSREMNRSELFRWIIANSPYYGIVLDKPLRDHIVVLFQLCLKAIVREAVSWAELELSEDTKKLSPVAMSYNCPILVGAMMWLSGQLSVLYNQVDGKRFAINMLKHCIINAAKNMSLFMVQKEDASPYLNNMEGEFVEPLKTSVNDEETKCKSVNGETIFVSQVAAAVAALHERALEEEKLKALSDTKPVPSYQRVAEHAYISKRADEERKRRPDYRPLLEFDGIAWHRPNDQEGNTTKTREELLAEQRDYKRRRMSYRGKKSNRNATEVMRDIIDDCMDSIKQGGGIGCLANVSDEAGKLFSDPSPSGVDSTDFGGIKKNVSKSSTVTSDHFNARKEELPSHDDLRYTRDKSLDDRKQRSRDSSRPYEPRNDRRTSDRDRHSREYYSRSVERERRHGSGHRDDRELSRTKRPRVSDYGDNLSHDRTNYQRGRGDRDSEGKDRRRKHSKRDHRADSVTSCVIEDRYNPYESRDMCEE